MIHEVPDQDKLFNEIGAILKTNGQLLIVEPAFHVSKAAFAETIAKAVNAGFTPVARPELFFSKAIVLKKN